MSIRAESARQQLPPPSRIDRGVPGLFHRGSQRRRVRRRRGVVWPRRERRLGPRLERELSGWAVALHSRLPSADLCCAPIDHLVVSPAGVWVIAADHELDRVTSGPSGAAVDARLDDVTQQAAACRVVLAAIGFDWLDIHLALCATNARGVVRRTAQVSDVWVTRPGSLTSLLCRAGPLNHSDIVTVAAELSRRFPAAH